MDARDEREFADIVVADKNVVFIPQVSDTISLPEFQRPESADPLKHGIALQIWNKALCPTLKVEQYAPDIFGTDVGNNEPILGFRRSFYHGKILVAGELSAEMYALGRERDRFVHKGKEFEQWYNSLASWIRRHYRRDPKYGMCIGPHAQQMLERGEIQLAQALMEGGRPI